MLLYICLRFISESRLSQILNVFLLFTELNTQIDSDLQALVSQMEAIEGATYELVTDEANQLEGILFQDSRMREAFHRFPDVVLFDATYKLNDRRMPLGVMMVIDGNGESQVAGLLIIKSENSATLVKLFEHFKNKNPNHTLIAILMLDKSMADKQA